MRAELVGQRVPADRGARHDGMKPGLCGHLLRGASSLKQCVPLADLLKIMSAKRAISRIDRAHVAQAPEQVPEFRSSWASEGVFVLE
ncbi:MAG: hypothetical protein ACRDK7_05945 [Solirubrobacteraceae bacterium]